MEAPKNNQSQRLGDTATAEQADVASFMVPEVVKKDITVSKSGSVPKPSGVATPGNPAA